MAEATWGYYGRAAEQAELERIMSAGRWFFCSITGRRRIGKTSLIRHALQSQPGRAAFYVQVPDSDERGVIQAFHDAYQDLGGSGELIRKSVRTIRHVALFIRYACEANSIVVIDEFQNLHRNALDGLVGLLQYEIDQLRDTTQGGLFVIGSNHRDMASILDDQRSPLYHRLTHRIDLTHWDFATLVDLLGQHGITDPAHRLFLWSMFEGVPKFYRDVFDQGLLGPDPDHRRQTLRRLFFEGSSPLADEAANWFLRDLRGRYESVLKTLAQLGACSYRDLVEDAAAAAPGVEKQPSAYLHTLIDRYRLVERREPAFAGEKSRKARYAIADNFLGAWLHALARNVQMARIRPVEEAIARADAGLLSHEALVFPRLVRQLFEAAARRGDPDYAITDLVKGYWTRPDRSGIEIDLIAVDEERSLIRFGDCRRSDTAFDGDGTDRFADQVDRFLASPEGRRFTGWRSQRLLFAPSFAPDRREALAARGFRCCDLDDLTAAGQPARP